MTAAADRPTRSPDLARRLVAVAQPKQAVYGPAGPAPVRPANSIRRTTSIDMPWPDGFGTQLRLDGVARDAITDNPGLPPIVVATATMSAGIGPNRDIQDIVADPDRAGLSELIGCRGGGHLRTALDEHLPGERESGRPLFLLLDDISGTSLIAGFAWSRWTEAWVNQPGRFERSSMEGVCIGFSPGSSALEPTGNAMLSHRVQQVGSLINDADPHGWHRLAELAEVSMRRARRIDVWVDTERGEIVIDSAFQDSSSDPELGRVAVHEYRLGATADLATMRLLTVEPDPRVLPFMECPSAVDNARELVGAPLGDLRAVVLQRLARTNGCTHLNDALRALAEVPVLLDQLRQHRVT
jgi:hypothetical protein